MRPVSSNKSRLPSPRTWLVLLVALVLTVTGLPFALAGDEPATDADDTAENAVEEGAGEETAGEATEEPIVVLPDEPASETPVDDGGDDQAPATETPAEPAPEPEKQDEATDETQAPADLDTDEPALAPTQATAQAEALAALAPDGGDFSIDWVASEPFSYSHVTGGGMYATGSNATTVESLNGGDFRCGDLVSYLAAISVDDSGATDASTLEFTTRFATLTSSQSGIGHEQIVRAVINTGDSGMDGDASVVSLDRSTGGGDLIGVVTVDDLEAGETIIVRIDVRLGCQFPDGARPTGTIHASLGDIRVVAPVADTVPGGAQTIPFKQGGVARELIVTKDVVGNQPANTTYTVEVTCLKGNTATLTFTGDGSQSAGFIPEGDTCTVTETDDGGADRTTVQVNGGAAQNGHTADIVIGASNEVTVTNTFLAATVTVGKTADAATVTPGGLITYTITATNTAASAIEARNVVVTDDLDDDLADVAATYSVGGAAAQNCDPVGAGNTIRCAVGNLAIGQSVVVTVTARATLASCGDVLNRATASGSNFVDVSSSQVTVTVLCAPDVSILKTSSTANAVPGQQFTYTITATNPSTATAAATGVMITDDLDDSLTGVTATYLIDGAGAPQNCDIDPGNVISCDIGTLAIGSSAVVTINVTATMASCPSVTNRASVSGNFPTEQSDAVDVTVTCTPDLTIDKTASKTTVVPGESWNYEITVASPSTATATSTDVIVTDNLHDGLVVAQPTFSVNGGAPQQCDAVGAGNTVRCAVGDLAPGDSAVVTIAATATVASCGDVVNLAFATASNIRDPEGSDPVTVEVVCEPALELAKTASAGTVDAGDDITYTITASNPSGTATATAEDVVVTDNLDDDLTGVTASWRIGAGAPTDCGVTGGGNFINCAIGDLAIGQAAVITITATTTEAACGVVTNTSNADGFNFTTVTSPTVDVTVVCPPDIAVVKSASATTVDIGDSYSYTITVTNNAGPTGSAAEDVVVTDDLDDDLASVAATYQVGAGPELPCDATGAGNTVRCAIGDLAIGASADITIVAVATEEACGSVTNVSTVSGVNFTTVTSNVVDVTIPCPLDDNPAISLVKTGSAPSTEVGDLITYTYEITNTGDTILLDVTLVDDILGTLTLTKTTLQIGETTTATATHLITEADVADGEVVNVATTTGRSPRGEPVSDEDTETIPIPGVQVPSIRLVKTPNTDFAEVGDTVTYEYVITNTGQTVLTDITLVDDKIGTIVSVDDALTLQPGESRTVEADYTLTPADLARGREVVNVAMASGLPPNGPPVTSTDRATVGIITVEGPGFLRVVKELDGDGEPADGATFGFNVDCSAELGPGRDNFTLPAEGGSHEVGAPLEDGTTCTVTETRTAGAESTTVAEGTGAPQVGTSIDVTIVEDVTTTVTFVNTFGTRPIIPPDDPDDPDLPATGAALGLQLLISLSALGIGGGMLRRFRPAASRPARGRNSAGWSTRL